ncbi:alpha-amylase family glycosyl hydrolase [Mesomycoplasma molare]|uniref:Alpha-amylase family glycosyl hydrolase n=1 Tax=Mesomycoplasma molare TaxID=171288 RepID=A0ABY5TUK5_9BACT|nr:alpha-amylase family glycosyl hydrolase [Mesomycoplasma molare]UWD34019.1 alpha-amylase family glycosyl hydrolase [Mesomycoplasma molare]
MYKYKGNYEDVFKNVDRLDYKLANKISNLGISKKNNFFYFRFWIPDVEEVYIDIFAKDDKMQRLATYSFKQYNDLWTVKVSEIYEGYYYLFKVKRKKNFPFEYVIDPYSKAFAPFDWEGKTNKIPLSVIVDWEKILTKDIPNIPLKSKWDNGVDPLIYELHIRDFTSLLDQKNFQNRLGTFNAALENNIFKYLKDLNITHLQLLPIQSIYTLNDKKLKILNKGQGSGWTTNYNWGYDPLNYFSIAGWYSSDPTEGSIRIREFKNFVNEAHKNGIGIIMDVVFNHMMTNQLFESIAPNYYFRNNSEITPVSDPAINSEARMVRKMIIDSLVYFAKYFGVDGFRFDLSTFTDKDTLLLAHKELKKINKNIILHGEAWPFSDLDFENSFTKGTNDNDIKFAYFNDTIRNSIKGSDSIEENQKGLIQGNYDNYGDFLVSIVGNVKEYNYPTSDFIKINNYNVFANEPNISLQYAACHDGFTLWDKIAVTSEEKFEENIALNNQALMMQITSQGRQLILAGTELLQTKPTDLSGQHDNRFLNILNEENNLSIDKNESVVDNSYKTTDYTNGMKWNHLSNDEIKNKVFEFTKKLFKFRNSTNFFRLKTTKEINKKVKFISIKSNFVVYSIIDKNDKIYVAHNFNNFAVNDFDYKNLKIKISSRAITKEEIKEQIIPAHTSIIFLEK